MNKETFSPGRYPFVVKDQNMPFHSRPGEEDCLNKVQSPVDERPNRTEHERSMPYPFIAVVIEHPWIDCHLINQTDENNDRNEVIMDSIADGSMESNVANEKARTNNRWNEKEEVHPKLDSLRYHVIVDRN